jgi:hypothetical protein
VVALGDVGGPAGGLSVGRGGSWEVAAELVQVADRDRAAEHGGGILAHRVVGEGNEVVVQARICGQSVSRALPASSCRAAMAASTWPSGSAV